MNFTDILGSLEELLPVLATMTGHPEIGTLAAALIDKAEAEVARRQAHSGKTRSEELVDAAATFAQAKAANDELKMLGHEGEGERN